MQRMNVSSATDSDLLAAWAHHRDESAFHELVVRYSGLVQMAAQRTCGDVSLAADASQLVFTQLAQNSKSLLGHPSIAGWLHVTASMKAKSLVDKTLREERKRRLFESAMDPQSSAPQENSWQEIQPYLTDAVNALSEKDREAILLRFYRSLSVREIAATLGIATDAAQKRLDRATERLRDKLTRRGVTTAGSLFAVMLAGFSTDAQAAVISNSVLSSKAIAASAAMPTGIFATLSAMKASTAIAPAVIILLSGTWMVRQRLETAELNRRSERLEASLASHTAESTNSISTVAAQPKKATRATSKIDAKTITAEYARLDGSVGGMRFYTKYASILEGMSSDEFGTLLKDLVAIGATDEGASELARIFMPLMLWQHFLYAFEHFLPQLETLSGKDVGGGFEKWAGEDLAAAARWLDLQVAAGKLDSKALDGPNPMRVMFESHLFSGLFRSDPSAASARLASLPEKERSLVFSEKYNTTESLTTTQLVQMSEIIRSHLPTHEQATQIAALAARNGKANLTNAAGFLDSIQAKPSERNAMAMDLALDFYGEKISQNALEEFRTSVRKFAPQQLDAATGKALAAAMLRDGTSFNDAAALALHYHEAGGGDDLLIHFCGSEGGKANKPAARLIAEKISNPQRREAMMNQLK
jgi:RNA polymerase sigma factor (sigma-70 family)